MQNPRNAIGPQLRRIRSLRGLSQPKLAEFLQRRGWDVSRDTIAKIEGQTRWVADFEAAFLANALEVPITELLPLRNRQADFKDFITRLERPLI